MKAVQKPYRHLDKSFNVEDWNEVEAVFNYLEEQPIQSKESLEQFIGHYNELLDEINNTDVQNYVLFSTNTTDEELEKKQRLFSEKILNRSRPYCQKIEKKIYEDRHLSALSNRYDNYRKILHKNIKTYNTDNLSLIDEEQVLCLKYRKTISNITVCYDDQEITLTQAERMLETAVNPLQREAIWGLVKRAWLQNQKALDDIFDNIIAIRHKIARNTGFENYGEYMHLLRDRFDYSLKEIKELHRSVEKCIIPVLKRVNEDRRKKLKLDKIKPWDEQLSVNKKSLKAFESSQDLVSKTYKVIENINIGFADKFRIIMEWGNLDLEIRKGKTPGGFCFPIDRAGNCYICMNVTGSPHEVNILLHESGHGIHALSHMDEPIREYRMFDGPGELAEFPAKTMELLALDSYHVYYNDSEDLQQAKKERFIDILHSLRRYILTDAFEQWIYENPLHTAGERTQYYKKLEDRFEVGVDWNHLDIEKGLGWYKSQLLVIQPLYTISYALAQVGALAVYKHYRENKAEAIEQFENFLTMGFSRPIGELYEAAGIRFDFTEDYIRKIVVLVEEELKILE